MSTRDCNTAIVPEPFVSHLGPPEDDLIAKSKKVMSCIGYVTGIGADRTTCPIWSWIE